MGFIASCFIVEQINHETIKTMKQSNNETMKHTTFTKIFNKKSKALVRQYQHKNVENPCIY
jgi:hypothetical protein